VRFDTLISSYFGETAANLHRLFADAQQVPCALFLDECDTIARSRADGNDVGEVPRIVNMLLQLLEDFHGGGMVIAATNLERALDHAMFRRFDEVIEVPKPGPAEIERLLRMTLDALHCEQNIVTLGTVEKLVGQPSSEVVKAARNAAKKSVLAGRERVTGKDLLSAINELRWAE
jgi:AAA+ superfamily predicted ATPase